MNRDAFNQPAYLRVSAGERKKRIIMLQEHMSSCELCPRKCRVNRNTGELGKCRTPLNVRVSSAGPHFGEERELVGANGSGTIFFVHCNLECLYCQNWSISRGYDQGTELSSKELAGLMLSLQNQKCSNINLVTPTPNICQIAKAIDLAAEQGLTIPIVYNCGGYEAVDAIRLLDGFIDIYMPDAKYGSNIAGEKYSGVSDYYSHFKKAAKEMFRQTGDLCLDKQGIAYRGVLVRHLVLPENIAQSEVIANFLSRAISPVTAVNVMNQYHPAYQSDEHPELNRRITNDEYQAAREAFLKAGLKLL